MAKLILQNQTEPASPDAGCTTLYVDNTDGKTKVKDSNGCVCSFATNIDISCINTKISNMSISAHILLIGGGGSAGCDFGASGYVTGAGGGGAGGYVEYLNYPLGMGKQYCVIIGQGGNWTDGGNSCFGTLVAYGGGMGGSSCAKCGFTTNGHNGGSGGGGGGFYNSCYAGGCGCTLQGGNGTVGHCGLGGGGYYDEYLSYGNQGCGRISCITGTATWYSVGGRTTTAQATGYGAGGNVRGDGSCQKCNKGVQGIFVISYPQDIGYNITGGTITCCNGFKIHTFTEDGTLCIN